MSYLAQWLSEAKADQVMTEQRLCIALRALRQVLCLSGEPHIKALAAAAIAQDREEQGRLMANPEASCSAP
jgi:hypothetical protein